MSSFSSFNPGSKRKEMVVAGFRRSLSFATSTSKPPIPTDQKPHHTRSFSLPCNSHPLISQLKDKINVLRSWESEAGATTTTELSSTSLCAALTHLKNVHDCLNDLLELPNTQDILRQRPQWVEKLLEDFLSFVDVFSIFQAALAAFKEEQLAEQVAIRRRDESKMGSFVKALKKMGKEMRKLAAVVRCIDAKCSSPADTDAELVSVLRDVSEITMAVSVALFNGMSSSSSSSTKSWKMGWRKQKMSEGKGIKELEEAGLESLRFLRKKRDEETMRIALKKLQALEDCIGRIESGNESVFRSLINTRVSFLNILTQ